MRVIALGERATGGSGWLGGGGGGGGCRISSKYHFLNVMARRQKVEKWEVVRGTGSTQRTGEEQTENWGRPTLSVSTLIGKKNHVWCFFSDTSWESPSADCLWEIRKFPEVGLREGKLNIWSVIEARLWGKFVRG